MSSYYIVPHINTLIFIFTYDSIHIGYAGDFHPINIIDLDERIIQGSEIINFNKFSEIIQKNCQEHLVDSAIIVLDHYISLHSEKMARIKLSEIKCLHSYLFLKDSICHAFGNGKINGTILCCNRQTANIFLIERGNIIEASKLDINLTENNQNDEKILNIEKYYSLVDQMMVLREKNKIKKNLISGAIIFAGDLFKDKDFFIKFKDYILNNYGPTFSELIIYNNQLDSCFTGASIFGMNNESKALFSVNNQ